MLANKLLLSTFSSLPKLKLWERKWCCCKDHETLISCIVLSTGEVLTYPAIKVFGISEKKGMCHKHLVFIAGKAWEGLGNMICLQDCSSFHDLRTTNQRLLKVKLAELMSGFSERETHLLDPIFVKA